MPSWSFSDQERQIMESGYSALTVEAVRLALGATALRQRVIAHNIANVDSPDHTRMKVVFEDQLAQALGAARQADVRDAALLVGIQAEMEPDVSKGKVQLDEEVAQMSANTVRYQALSRGISRYLSIAGLIASANKG